MSDEFMKIIDAEMVKAFASMSRNLSRIFYTPDPPFCPTQRLIWDVKYGF